MFMLLLVCIMGAQPHCLAPEGLHLGSSLTANMPD
jgi:hypothetical protein